MELVTRVKELRQRLGQNNKKRPLKLSHKKNLSFSVVSKKGRQLRLGFQVDRRALLSNAGPLEETALVDVFVELRYPITRALNYYERRQKKVKQGSKQDKKNVMALFKKVVLLSFEEVERCLPIFNEWLDDKNECVVQRDLFLFLLGDEKKTTRWCDFENDELVNDCDHTFWSYFQGRQILNFSRNCTFTSVGVCDLMTIDKDDIVRPVSSSLRDNTYLLLLLRSDDRRDGDRFVLYDVDAKQYRYVFNHEGFFTTRIANSNINNDEDLTKLCPAMTSSDRRLIEKVVDRWADTVVAQNEEPVTLLKEKTA